MLVKVTIEMDGRQVGEVVQELNGSAVQVEEQVRELQQRGGRIVLENSFGKVSAESPRPRCCGRGMRSRGQRLLTIQTTFGPVIVSRRRYRCCACGAESYPGDDLCRTGRHAISRPLAKRICQLATVEHFTRLAPLLADQHGLHLSHEALLELVHDVGAVAEAQRRAAAQDVLRRTAEAAREIIPVLQPQRVCVSCDGIMYCTNQTEPDLKHPGQQRLVWQQMKVGCVSWQEADGLWHKQILWGRESPEEFGAALFELACRYGYRQAPEKLFSADGGAWCWEIRDLYFGAATGILDWYHVSEHVWEAARLVETEGVAASDWAHQALGLLRHAGGTGLVEWLEQQRGPRRGRAREALDALLTYLAPRISLTDYPTYRSRDLPIGTGMMESTCKQLVGLRLKGPGMHWTEAGALAVTALRATDLNHHWNSFWSCLVLAM